MNEGSTFDSAAFLMGTQVSGAMAEEFPRVPPDVYKAVIVNRDRRTFDVKQYDKKSGDGGKVTIFRLFWQIDAPGNDEAHEKYVRQSIMLDLDEAGKIAVGKDANPGLGMLRKAVGQNDPDQDWNFGMLEGQAAMIKVTETTDANDPDRKYSEVSSVAPIV